MSYESVPALLPAMFTPSTQVLVLDIDGDGFNEVLVLTPDLGQLAVIHRFTYSQLSASSADWSDTAEHWWNQWTTPPQGTVAGGWTIQFGDSMVAGDFDGDGHDELFLYNSTTLQWGILQWQSATNELSTIYSSTNGCPNWTPGAGDRFFFFPQPNGASTPGLLVFNTVSFMLGVLQYDTEKGMSCPTATPGENIVYQWTFHKNDQFHAGLFAGATASAFLLFNSDGYIACLSWDGTAFSLSKGQSGTLGQASGGTGTWDIRGSDWLACLDLNGDGFDEVFVYNGSDQPGYVGAWIWVAENQWFETLAATNSVAGWTIGQSDQYSPTQLSAGNGLLAYNSERAEVAILQLSSGNEFQGDAVSRDLSIDNQWPVTQQDVYYGPSILSQASPAQFVMSSQSLSPGLDPVPVLGAVSVGPGPISVASEVALPPAGWTPALLAQAPLTNVPEWTSTELAVYQYLGNLFCTTYVPNLNVDIRSLYGNAGLRGDLGTFGGNLKLMVNPAGQGFSPTDWTNVTAVISMECQTVYTIAIVFYTNLLAQAGYIQAWQGKDLATAQTNIQDSLPAGYSQTPSPASYWEGQFVVAALWGLAAITGDVVLGVSASIIASLAGSALGASSTRSDPLQTEYSAIASAITGDYDSALSSSIVTAPSALFADPGKLRIFNELNGTTWNIPDASTTSEAAFQAIDRRSLYAQLLPCVYSIAVIPNPSLIDKPYYFTGQPGNQKINYFGDPNPDGHHAIEIDGVPYFYALYVNNGSQLFPFQPFEASADLTSDLFGSLGIDKADLLAGVGMWSNIPRLLFAEGYAPGSNPFA